MRFLRNKKIYEMGKILRYAGTTSDPKKLITNNCVEVSLNHKIDTINAAFLLVSFSLLLMCCYKICYKIKGEKQSCLQLAL